MKSWLLVGLIGWLVGLAPLHAGEVRVTHVAAEVREGMLYVDADARVDLFDAQREALLSGVPLTFAWEFSVEQERPWLWSRDVESQAIHARIEYHALSRLYRVIWPDSEESATFATLDGALEALTHLRALALAPASAFPKNGAYRGRTRLRLVLENLPLPMRPRAYFSDRWQLASEWYLWAP